jgi:hypothetical protein
VLATVLSYCVTDRLSVSDVLYRNANKSAACFGKNVVWPEPPSVLASYINTLKRAQAR